MASTVSQPAQQDAPWQTHTVFNQAPPLEGVDVFSSNLPLVEATEREGAGWVQRARRRARRARRRRAAAAVGPPGQREQAGAAHARPLRQPHRRGRVPPGLAPADDRWASSTSCTRCRGRASEPFAHTARAALYMTAMQAEAGFCLPDHDDLRGRARAARAARAGRRVGAAGDRHHAMTRARSPPREKGSAIAGMAMTEKQGGSDVRANTTVAHAAERRRRGRRVRARSGTSGSARRRCPTSSSCSRRPTTACPASCCRASCPTARATRFTSSA